MWCEEFKIRNSLAEISQNLTFPHFLLLRFLPICCWCKRYFLSNIWKNPTSRGVKFYGKSRSPIKCPRLLWNVGYQDFTQFKSLCKVNFIFRHIRQYWHGKILWKFLLAWISTCNNQWDFEMYKKVKKSFWSALIG